MDKSKQIYELSETKRTTKNRRLFERYQVVKLVLEGVQIKEAAARIINRDPHTVGNYVASYKKGWIEALQPKKQSGRPHRLTQEQESELREIVAFSTPEEVSFSARATGLFHWLRS
ncbi:MULTISPECIES: helix-turn-helix domain-containing protein [unclassified Oceanobacillus]|uniref:helix-turn-helix domain-containing protein n=1 Tax=unclassified Oceanobacillus TaxID=2630292 RepID=UPI00300DD8FC